MPKIIEEKEFDRFKEMDEKVTRVLKYFEDGHPMKDYWTKNDTIELMEAYREVYWMWSDMNE